MAISVLDAQRALDAKTKPPGSLGRLEGVAIRLCVLQNTLSPSAANARVCVFGGDHGVTVEGVSAYPSSVTTQMMANFHARGAAINAICRANDVSLEVIDVGVAEDVTSFASIIHAKVRRGTRNFAHGPAMTNEELIAATAVGMEAARRAADAGIHVLGLGEMGIGNTCSASALLSALLDLPARDTTGSGTGVHGAGLDAKLKVVDAARMSYSGKPAREILRGVGGLEIAAMGGAALEGARRGMAILADGFISTVAIFAAARVARDEHDAHALACLARALFFSHASTEPGHRLAYSAIADVLGIAERPLLDLGMRLGEGTGAALAVPLMRAATAVVRDMATFESAGVSGASNG